MNWASGAFSGKLVGVNARTLRSFVPSSLLVLLASGALSSCRLTESLDGFAASGGAAAEDAGGTGGLNDSGVADSEPQDASQEATGGAAGSALDAEPEAWPGPCSTGDCVGGCMNCDNLTGCETDPSVDTKNCGACAHDCQGGACVHGICQSYTLTSQINMPWSIYADETSAYWVAEGPLNSGFLMSIPVNGGATNTLASGQAGPKFVLGDDQYLFWTTFASGGAIWRIEKAGANLKQLSSAKGPQGLAQGSSYLWWTNASDGSIRRVPKNSSQSSVVTTGQPNPIDIATDPSNPSRVYFTTATDGGVKYYDADGNKLTTLSTSNPMPLAVAVDAQYVYWANAGSFANGECLAADGTIMSANKENGWSRTQLADKQACPQRIWMDGGTLYWTNAGTSTSGTYNNDGSIMRNVAGPQRTTEVVEGGQVRPYGIATNATSIFWTEQGLYEGTGSVKKRAK